MLKRIFNVIKLYFSLAITGILFVILDIGTILISIIVKDSPKRRLITRKWLRLVAATDCWCLQKTGILNLDVSALTHDLRTYEQTIFIANHPSRLDTVILTANIPNLVCVTKPTIWDSPFLGRTLQQGGYICFNKILQIIGSARQRVEEGCPLFVFPEGTRSGPLSVPEKVFSGFSALSMGTKASIQVLFIKTDSPYLSQGWSYLKCPQTLPMNYTIELGPRFKPPKNEDEGRKLIERFSHLCQEDLQAHA